MRKLLIAVVFPMCAGCATTAADINSSITGAAQSAIKLLDKVEPSPAPYASARGATTIAKTKLNGILAQNPSAGSSAALWPRIAIRDLEIPQWQVQGAAFNRPVGTADCIYFNVTLWRTNTQSERIENIELCGNELSRNQDNNFVSRWKALPINSTTTTGQKRTEGPVPPKAKLPTAPEIDTWFWNHQALWYLGTLLTKLGYDQGFVPEETSPRVWVVNLKKNL